MSCNTSAIRTVFDSPTVQAVAANGIINMPEVTTTGRCLSSASGVTTIRKNGTYHVDVNVTTVATAAGVEEVQLYRNGSPIPGAHALGTAAAVGDNVPMAFSALVSVDNAPVTLDIRSTPATSVRVANVTIK